MLQKKRYIFNQIKYDRKITISYLKITKKSFHSKSGDSNPSDTEWYCQNWLLQLKIKLIKNLLSFDKNQNTIFFFILFVIFLWFFMITKLAKKRTLNVVMLEVPFLDKLNITD